MPFPGSKAGNSTGILKRLSEAVVGTLQSTGGGAGAPIAAPPPWVMLNCIGKPANKLVSTPDEEANNSAAPIDINGCDVSKVFLGLQSSMYVPSHKPNDFI